jgi:hypothetical protein
MRDPVDPWTEAIRVLELSKILIGLQEDILGQIERVLAVLYQTEQVVENPLFPSGYQQVVSLDVVTPGLPDQVAVLNLPKDQLFGSVSKTQEPAEKSELAHCTGFSRVTCVTFFIFTLPD